MQSDNIEKNLKYINAKTCYTEVLKFMKVSLKL